MYQRVGTAKGTWQTEYVSRRESRNQKEGFPSSRNSVSAGGLGGAVSPAVGPGQSLGGGPGGEAPRISPDFEFFLP